MEHYRQLTLGERYQISTLNKLGYTQTAIAQTLKRNKSTISRELQRNSCVKAYDASQAQRFSVNRRKKASKANKRCPELIEWVVSLLKEKWSPEQIAGSARTLGFHVVSHEWIYQLIIRDKASGGDLATHLRHKQRRYRRRYGKQDRRGRIVNRVGIENRPAIVGQRKRYGDWEGDSIVGKGRAALVTLLERKSGEVIVRKVERSTAAFTAKAIISMLNGYRCHTLTLDNGMEFAHHEKIANALGCDIYFARPYHSWERGANENVNGLIRQYFPKQTNFDDVTDEQIQAVENALNMRPRKRLSYKAPIEFIDRLLVA